QLMRFGAQRCLKFKQRGRGPDTRGVRVVGWEADLRAEPPASGAKQSLVHRPTQAVWSEATQIRCRGFSNLSAPALREDDLFMPHFPQTQSKTRSPRVRVPNNESIRFILGGHQVSAVLQKISLTGGLAEFPSSIGSATIAEAKVNTLSGQVSGLVEFLPPQNGSSTYPFRIIALSDQDYER